MSAKLTVAAVSDTRRQLGSSVARPIVCRLISGGGEQKRKVFMRLGLTTEGAETPVRAARKEACERIRFAQLGRNSPTLDGRQMICGRGVDEWHEVRLPPSSFRAPRSGFPCFQWLTDLSTVRGPVTP